MTVSLSFVRRTKGLLERIGRRGLGGLGLFVFPGLVLFLRDLRDLGVLYGHHVPGARVLERAGAVVAPQFRGVIGLVGVRVGHLVIARASTCAKDRSHNS